jgi:hypothetical protein
MESDETNFSRLRLYLRVHLNDSRRIGSLAECTLAQLRTDARILSTYDPVQQLREITALVLARDTEAIRTVALRDGTLGTGEEDSLDAKLHRRLVRALMELPPEHARLLLAHKQGRLSCEEIAERFAISRSIAALYLSQARALVRMCGWSPDSRRQRHCGDEYQRTLLTAHQAADWLVQFSNGGRADHIEFLRWLRKDAFHVREFLMAQAWEDALDALPALSTIR